MAKTPSFVTGIPLRVTPAQESTLRKRLEASRQVYNACLGEALRRLDLMRQSKQWQAARKMPKGNRESDDPVRVQQAKDRADAFKDCWVAFDLQGKYSLQGFAKQFNRCWLGDHLGSQLIKAIAKKAFVWVKEYALDSKRGRPRFRRFGEYNSAESGFIGKEFLFEKVDDKYLVIWTIGKRWNAKLGKFKGTGPIVQMEAMVDYDNAVMMHGLNSPLKYVRLVRRTLNGKTRFYVQLVCKGKPYQRFEMGAGTVGLDIGPSTVAIVGPDEARLKLFCEELESSKAKERRLQRKLDRRRRANNPDNYNADGTVKPRNQRKRWVRSNRQRQTEVALAEVKRKQAAYRKSLHGQLVNEILQMGDVVKLEKLSYVAFQKMFGKSVGVRAPGMFVAQLNQKMHDYGGLVDEFSTYSTKLSQVDHKTGEYQKKPLSQRWHRFDDGERVQRDLYSAFLAACVEDGRLSKALADERWTHIKPLLDAAVLDVKDMNKRPSSFGF